MTTLTSTLAHRPRQHPLFWLMFVADLVLVGLTATLFPGATGAHLATMVAVLLVASFLMNLALTPAEMLPFHAGTSRGVARSDSGATGEGSLRLLQHVLATQEEERARLARELRELVAQSIVGIGCQLAAVAASADPAAATAELEFARDSVRDAIEEIAVIADELYPGLLGELGIVAALESLRRRVTRRTQLPCELVVEGEPFALPLPLTRALYRFAEEAIENVERHAVAYRAITRLQFSRPVVTLEISDDGQGFCSDQPTAIADGVGLHLARELLASEGATMQIDSVPGRGTRVSATATVLTEG